MPFVLDVAKRALVKVLKKLAVKYGVKLKLTRDSTQKDVNAASSHALLVKRLTDARDTVGVRLHLDGKTLLNDDKFYYQRSRVKKLHELGATVYLCSGRKPKGVFHKKSVIADRRWMFSGGANSTHSARHANSEFLMKLIGKGVMDALASLEQERLKARLWDGRFA